MCYRRTCVTSSDPGGADPTLGRDGSRETGTRGENLRRRRLSRVHDRPFGNVERTGGRRGPRVLLGSPGSRKYASSRCPSQEGPTRPRPTSTDPWRPRRSVPDRRRGVVRLGEGRGSTGLERGNRTPTTVRDGFLVHKETLPITRPSTSNPPDRVLFTCLGGHPVCPSWVWVSRWTFHFYFGPSGSGWTLSDPGTDPYPRTGSMKRWKEEGRPKS